MTPLSPLDILLGYHATVVPPLPEIFIFGSKELPSATKIGFDRENVGILSFDADKGINVSTIVAIGIDKGLSKKASAYFFIGGDFGNDGDQPIGLAGADVGLFGSGGFYEPGVAGGPYVNVNLPGHTSVGIGIAF
jgi:hypothetical protein